MLCQVLLEIGFDLVLRRADYSRVSLRMDLKNDDSYNGTQQFSTQQSKILHVFEQSHGRRALERIHGQHVVDKVAKCRRATIGDGIESAIATIDNGSAECIASSDFSTQTAPTAR